MNTFQAGEQIDKGKKNEIMYIYTNTHAHSNTHTHKHTKTHTYI